MITRGPSAATVDSTIDMTARSESAFLFTVSGILPTESVGRAATDTMKIPFPTRIFGCLRTVAVRETMDEINAGTNVASQKNKDRGQEAQL